MRRKYDIVYLLLALLAMTACREDEPGLGEQLPGDGTLRFQGVNAQHVEVKARSTERKGWFPLNSLYRIWAYGNENGDAERTLRFDACGVETANGNNRLIALPEGTTLNFKSDADVIDFYGLIDPEIKDDDIIDEEKDQYLKATGADDNPEYEVKYGEGNAITDLRYASKIRNTHSNTGYIIPLEFKHILSKVEFEVVQQPDEMNNTTGKFGNIYLENIQVVDRPATGTFGIRKGEFTALGSEGRTFELLQEPDKLIGVVPSNVGSILLFPTAETEAEPMKVKITLRGEANTFSDFLGQEGYDVTDNGAKLTVTCPVYDSYKINEENPVPLRLLPNYRYVLQFMIMGHDVRIVTVVPRVYEWLDGETDQTDGKGDYWEEQNLGQPVTFNGVVWSDRNLGATSANPLASVEEWRKSVGYFYQFNRNIPYFPNTYNETTGRIDLNTPLEDAFFEQKDNNEGDNREVLNGKRRLYPVVNYGAWGVTEYPELDLLKPQNANIGQGKEYVTRIGELPTGSTVWGLSAKDLTPGEEKLWQGTSDREPILPCPKGWRIPTQEDFMGILPSSVYAGNISLRIFTTSNNTSGGWSMDGDYATKEPDFPAYFTPGGVGINTVATGAVGMKDDNGNLVNYFGSFPCLYREEENDPKQGNKSQYVLSMLGEDWTLAMDGSAKMKDKDYIYNWGTIYGIKNVGTTDAYRVRWEIKLAGDFEPVTDPAVFQTAQKYCNNNETTMYAGKTAKRYADGLLGVIVISRYPSTKSENFNPDENGSYEWVAQKKGWWEHPSEVLYLPICGVAGKWNGGHLYNIGSEVWYASVHPGTSSGRKQIVWIKFAGGNNGNQALFWCEKSPQYDVVSIRPVRD